MVKVQRLFAKTNLKIQVCRTDKIPLGTKGRTSILSYREYVRPAELHSRSAEKNCLTENVSSLRSVKGATLPCDACASIPCGLAVRKQHEMLFAASKFDINKSLRKESKVVQTKGQLMKSLHTAFSFAPPSIFSGWTKRVNSIWTFNSDTLFIIG